MNKYQNEFQESYYLNQLKFHVGKSFLPPVLFLNMKLPGYFTQSLPAFQRKVYHPKGVVEADINLVNFFGS